MTEVPTGFKRVVYVGPSDEVSIVGLSRDYKFRRGVPELVPDADAEVLLADPAFEEFVEEADE